MSELHKHIDEEISKRINQLSDARRWFENEVLMDENSSLKQRNSDLTKRNELLETHKVVPFTLNSFDPSVTLYDLEKQYTLNAIRYFNGDKIKAANALGITIKTLYNKLSMWGEI